MSRAWDIVPNHLRSLILAHDGTRSVPTIAASSAMAVAREADGLWRLGDDAILRAHADYLAALATELRARSGPRAAHNAAIEGVDAAALALADMVVLRFEGDVAREQQQEERLDAVIGAAHGLCAYLGDVAREREDLRAVAKMYASYQASRRSEEPARVTPTLARDQELVFAKGEFLRTDNYHHRATSDGFHDGTAASVRPPLYPQHRPDPCAVYLGRHCSRQYMTDAWFIGGAAVRFVWADGGFTEREVLASDACFQWSEAHRACARPHEVVDSAGGVVATAPDRHAAEHIRRTYASMSLASFSVRPASEAAT